MRGFWIKCLELKENIYNEKKNLVQNLKWAIAHLSRRLGARRRARGDIGRKAQGAGARHGAGSAGARLGERVRRRQADAGTGAGARLWGTGARGARGW